MSSRSREWAKLSVDVQALIEAQQQSAPIKLSEIARQLGVVVRSATLPVGISGEIRPSVGAGNFTIKVNRHDDPKRQRFTVAHELAHFLLHREYIGNGLSDDVLYRSSLSDTKEAQANRLAADILMPRHLIEELKIRLLDADDVISDLAEAFNVSTTAMQIRVDRA
jgi:Predicted Zn peptidase